MAQLPVDEPSCTVGARGGEFVLRLEELLFANQGEHRGEVLVGHDGTSLMRYRGQATLLKGGRGELDAVGADADCSVVRFEDVHSAAPRCVGLGRGLEHVVRAPNLAGSLRVGMPRSSAIARCPRLNKVTEARRPAQRQPLPETVPGTS